ncbi:prepilin-type N-terminal cleavage/methylation domain-containing protein [Sulfurimonas microaerophilic]|uniref:prepilin-type N-terminal cleavage/methylation domain-containing protein n=1 Tax=Sulfurimonas microaerophilic TaxID=3058392 RepID=UPI002714641C|nr:prepilin-type N-terminal cleavage/methylation domain-containing protein [Sulfurimonas sp. hsl 1-7]
MKKAFTMMELIFVIIVMGILAAIVTPRVERDLVREAAIQLVSHIRYTQHLALVDDKYNLNTSDPDDRWWRGRWQLKFKNSNTETNGEESYTIFSDSYAISTYSGNANSKNEIATNPQDKSKKLTGGDSAVHYDNKEATRSMNLGMTYGITNVGLGSNCTDNNSKGLAFDHLGRPLKGGYSSFSSPYPSSSNLITSDCNITLTGASGSIIVTITPETGYTYIAN